MAPSNSGPTPHRRWDDMVLYQIYPRSFADSSGDGVGDLSGITAHIDYLAALGVDGIWLNPIMASPGTDHGYDVSDPRAIDPLFGTVADFAALIDAVHAHNMVLIMDLVPNHTSDQHIFFQEALRAAPGDPARERYIFRDGRGTNGELPPNNWPSIFGGPAWTREPSRTDGHKRQWFLTLFASTQPDVNWDNDDIRADMDATLRHWLRLGVDGFRIDVAHGMAKPAGLPDIADLDDLPQLIMSDNDVRFDQPGVHALHRRIRAVVDEFDNRRTFAEAWVGRPHRLAAYLRPDELHHAFGFALTEAAFDAESLQHAIEDTLQAARLSGAAPTWALSNHDVQREVTRYGGGEVGRARARAAALCVLALPGIPFIYAGAELGLPDAKIPPDRLTDPIYLRLGDPSLTRDPCRVPLPWSGDSAPYGFSDTANTWLPQPDDWAELTVAAQESAPDLMLRLYRRAIAVRRGFASYTGPELSWLDAPTGVLRFTRPGAVECVVNTTDTDMSLHSARNGDPAAAVVLHSASSVDADKEADVLPAHSAVWLAQP